MDKPILILGAGTFGLSTAYHLAKAGYKNITVLEKSRTMPPEQSAGNDLNKIIRAEYEDPFYTDIALKAMQAWKQPPFKPYYHEVGYLLTVSEKASEKAKETLRKSRQSVAAHPAWDSLTKAIDSRDDIRSVAPVFDGPMAWTGYFNKFAGYAEAGGALKGLYEECLRLGVKIKLGEAAERLVFAGNGTACRGAIGSSGLTYTAEMTVVAMGASVATVLPSIGSQISAVGFPVAHVQLTAEETARLRGIPVTYARDIGFFFEPDGKTNLLKLCNTGSAYTNFVTSPGTNGGGKLSIAPRAAEDCAFISDADVEAIRQLLRETLPSLADRPLVKSSICWCADSTDTEFIVDHVPGHEGLIVVSGDSGHGFKMLPIVGEWVLELLQKGAQDTERWKWKSVKDGQEHDVSWRISVKRDLREVRPSLPVGPIL